MEENDGLRTLANKAADAVYDAWDTYKRDEVKQAWIRLNALQAGLTAEKAALFREFRKHYSAEMAD